MASLKDLIVMGPARFLDKLYGNLEGNAATASRLGTSTIGASDRPIYLSGGTATSTTYRMAATNATATSAHSITTDLPTGIWYVSGTSDILGQSDGVAIANQYNANWISEIYQDYRTGLLAVRSKNNGTWQNWRKIPDSTGTNASGDWDITSRGLKTQTTLTSSTIDNFLEAGVVKWATADSTAVGENDGVVMSFGWSSNFGAQMWLDDGSGEGGMKIRNRTSSAWNPWRQVLTEYNYNNYAPTKTGVGASGTWGIHITGSAATLKINNSASLGDCLQYIQTSSQTSGNDLPSSSWWHVLKMNHGIGDTYYKRLLAFDFFSHKIKTNYAESNGAIKEWRSVLDSESGVARAHYSTTNTGSAYILVTINKETSWMLNFTLRLYQSYVATDIQISGYNYGGSYWYSPDAVVLGSTSSSAQTIYFGYTGAYKLWVAVPASNYTGADVFGATNGYTQIDDLSEAFTITRVSSLPGTTQSTLTRYRPWYRDETVSNATYATSAGSANSVAWGNVTGKPSTFTPESHTHSYLPLSGGTLSGRLTLNTSIADHGNPTAQCLVINSSAVPSGTTLTDKNAPGIGFHINNNSWGSLIFNGGNFKFINNDATGYMPVYASTFYGNLSGTATKATQDGSGNTITSTYLKLSGGSMTGAISITTNGVTNSFYSQNSSFTHYSTTASAGHWFNKAVYVAGEIYAGSSYNQRVYHMGNIVYGSQPTNPVDRMIWLYPA